ncbi:hypothetical protein C8J57DRAFT_1245655 [Mycena rebaudengoi]|nr:hypothetical protein C8J57DRAFT_1245655 [Mycena rebaudengoi]
MSGRSGDCAQIINQMGSGAAWIADGGTDNFGNRVNATEATGIIYPLCLQICGTTPLISDWKQFSQQFREDLKGRSMHHWILHQFSNVPYSNAPHAARALNALQQVSLNILAPLNVMPQNDQWWSELFLWLEMDHDIGSNRSPFLTSGGVAVGFGWLWLLPIIVSWLRIGPRCNAVSLRNAISHATTAVCVASDGVDLTLSQSAFSRQQIPLSCSNGGDEDRSPPIYNYSRIFSWTFAAEEILAAFQQVSHPNTECLSPIRTSSRTTGEQTLPRLNANIREGSPHEASNFTRLPRNSLAGISRVCTSSLAALCLTWGTVGAAIVVNWFTPTQGLGCRSGIWFIYASSSTLVWLMLVTSSILSHYATLSSTELETRNLHLVSLIFTQLLRRFGKILAYLNSLWIVMTVMFEFAGLYNTCWCNSNVFNLGSRAYTVFIITSDDIYAFWSPLVWATMMAGSSATGFVALNIYLNPL